MSLRHAVLGMLSVTSCTGYELMQWFDSSLQHAWHASHSQIYPELAKLEAELAHVEAAAEERRRLTAQLDAEGKTGGFRPVLDLAARVDPAMIGWLRDQIEATEAT